MKKLAVLFPLFFLTVFCIGQNTALTATITDSESQTWNNGSYTFTLYNPGGGPYAYTTGGAISQTVYTGAMNSSGVLTVTLPDVNKVVPYGTTYKVSLCSNTSAPCSPTINGVIVTGATQNLSSALSAAITPPVVYAQIAPTKAVVLPAFAYTDGELAATITGAFYFRVTDNTCRQFNGATWQNCGTGAGSTGITCSPTCTTNIYPIFTSASSVGNGHLDETTLTGWVTSQLPFYSYLTTTGVAAFANRITYGLPTNAAIGAQCIPTTPPVSGALEVLYGNVDPNHIQNDGGGETVCGSLENPVRVSLNYYPNGGETAADYNIGLISAGNYDAFSRYQTGAGPDQYDSADIAFLYNNGGQGHNFVGYGIWDGGQQSHAIWIDELQNVYLQNLTGSIYGTTTRSQIPICPGGVGNGTQTKNGFLVPCGDPVTIQPGSGTGSGATAVCASGYTCDSQGGVITLTIGSIPTALAVTITDTVSAPAQGWRCTAGQDNPSPAFAFMAATTAAVSLQSTGSVGTSGTVYTLSYVCN